MTLGPIKTITDSNVTPPAPIPMAGEWRQRRLTAAGLHCSMCWGVHALPRRLGRKPASWAALQWGRQ